MVDWNLDTFLNESCSLPRLDLRLRTVAGQIRARCHADIGSDHGNLLVALLRSGRIQSGIAIENKRQPFENSRMALAGLKGEARFADGLNGLSAGEAESLSICGMGGEAMVAILQASPDRIPPKIVLQPNRRVELVRQWAFESGFHLIEEQIARGHWPYIVLTYASASEGDDPAYSGDDHEADLMFGPICIRRRDADFVDQLIEERRYLRGLNRLSDASGHRLTVIERVLRRWKVDVSS